MADIRDRLQKLERLLAEKLVCQECLAVVVVVVGPGEDATPNLPGPCGTCGRDRNVTVVVSPLHGRIGSMKAARDGINPAGSLRIDEPDHCKAIAPPQTAVN